MVDTMRTLSNRSLPKLYRHNALIVNQDIVFNGKVSATRYPQSITADAMHCIVSPDGAIWVTCRR